MPGRRRKILWLLPVFLLLLALASWRAWQCAITPSDGPLIGISVDDAWHSHLGLTTGTYPTAVARAGARSDEFRYRDGEAAKRLDEIDGLLLAGGGDVDPVLYDGDPKEAKYVSRDRDDFELSLIKGALARDMPILGVCRGLQILNVAHGGSLRNIRADPAIGPGHGGNIEGKHTHSVQIKSGTRLAAIDRPGPKNVNSFHGQAIDRLGKELTATASTADGVVEAIERADRRFVLATQWHPEILSLKDPNELLIFSAFVRAAEEYARSKGE